MDDVQQVIREVIATIKGGVASLAEENRNGAAAVHAAFPDCTTFVKGLTEGADVAYNSVIDGLDRWLLGE